MNIRNRQSVTGYPRVVAGEIDTSAPFQSVKDAVSLFGESAFSGDKPSIKKEKPHPVEGKESDLHWARKDLNKLKEQMENAETTRTQALAELERAKKTAEDLSNKLKIVMESKKPAMNEIGAAIGPVKQLEEASSDISLVTDGTGKQHLQGERGQHMAITEADMEKATQIEDSSNKAFSDTEIARAPDPGPVRDVSAELEDAKEMLQKVAGEETYLRGLVESLKLELENVKREHSELKEKEAKTESLAGSLHVRLRKSKSELEAAGTSDELISMVHQLSLKAETSRREMEELKSEAERLKKEDEAAGFSLVEAEEKLGIAMEEAEEAREAELRALDRHRILSERTSAARASASEITLSIQELEALSRKVEELSWVVDMKVAAANAEVAAVRASEKEALKRLEVMWEEIAGTKAAAREALERAEMAEAARRVVEGELRRWHERETMAPVVAESSPRSSRIQKQSPPEKVERRSPMSKKTPLLPNLSGLFHRKKHVEGR